VCDAKERKGPRDGHTSNDKCWNGGKHTCVVATQHQAKKGESVVDELNVGE
jgi:hypothetical protein